MPNPGFYHHAWRRDRGRPGTGTRGAGARRAGAARARPARLARRPDRRRDHRRAGSRAPRPRRGLAHGPRRRDHRRAHQGRAELGIRTRCSRPFTRCCAAGRAGSSPPGTSLPPLVHDIEARAGTRTTSSRGARRGRSTSIWSDELERSQLLHRLPCSGIAGLRGARRRPRRPTWTRRGSAGASCEHRDFDGAAIEAARYGPTVADAAAARLLERLARASSATRARPPRAPRRGAVRRCGVAGRCWRACDALIRGDGDFLAVAGGAAALLYLYRYDARARHGRATRRTGGCSRPCYDRVLWLLEAGPRRRTRACDGVAVAASRRSSAARGARPGARRARRRARAACATTTTRRPGCAARRSGRCGRSGRRRRRARRRPGRSSPTPSSWATS